jgi:cobalt/nickel transport system ATP-binding protein
VSQVRERVEEMLRWLGLSELRDRPPYRLSGGEKRKVALAAVLVVEPEVLLLDEPTTFLDPHSLGQFLDLLGEWGGRGGTMVLCTHDLELAAELAVDAYLLGQGRVLADGAIDDLLADQALMERAGLTQRRRQRQG